MMGIGLYRDWETLGDFVAGNRFPVTIHNKSVFNSHPTNGAFSHNTRKIDETPGG